jgi:polygalacturonase
LRAAPAAEGGLQRKLDPRVFGAKGDGKSMDTASIQKAIDSLAAQGGGTVVLSPGTYLSGTVVLRSNITLQLERGATILGSPDPNDYTLPPEALLALRGVLSRHLIFAFQATNVTILGPGAIDGNAASFMVPSGRQQPKPEELWRDVAAFDRKRTIGISPMVDLATCTNVRVEGVRLQNSDGWALRPTGCKSVVIRGVTVRNPINGSNTDGIDPTSCEDVLIADCDIVTGDDAICVKSNNPYGGRSVCSNVTVRNCRVSTCCNGLKVGVEGPADFYNIIFDHCIIDCADGPLNQRAISGIAVEMADGALIDGVTFTNITMRNVRTPVFIRLQGKMTHNSVPMRGALRNVRLEGVRAEGAILTSSITGQPGFPVENVTLSNVHISTVEHGRLEWADLLVPEKTNAYPEANMFGRLSAYGFYVRHAHGLKLKNVSVDGASDPRPLFFSEDVGGLSLTNLSGTASSPSQPLLRMKNVRDASIQSCKAPAGTAVFVEISGEASRNISLRQNDLSQAKQPLETTSEVPKDALNP